MHKYTIYIFNFQIFIIFLWNMCTSNWQILIDLTECNAEADVVPSYMSLIFEPAG